MIAVTEPRTIGRPKRSLFTEPSDMLFAINDVTYYEQCLSNFIVPLVAIDMDSGKEAGRERA